MKLYQSLNSLPVLPVPFPPDIVLAFVLSLAVLRSIFPHPLVHSSIRPCDLSHSLLLVVHVIAFINSAVWPFENSLPMHLVILPMPLVFLLVGP